MIKAKVLAAVLVLIAALPTLAVQRLVLLENETNTSCGPCYPADLLLDQLCDQHPDVFVAIRYHAWWPSSSDPFYVYNSSENGARINYYPAHPDGYYYTPYAWIDGIVRGGYSYSSWWNFILSRSSDESPVEIRLGGSFYSTGRTGTLDVTLIGADLIDVGNLKLRIALTESDIHWIAPNGITVHHQTFRDMMPSATGAAINLAQGDTVNYSQPFTCPTALNWSNCELVVFLQSDATREVLQAARITLLELDQQVSINDNAELPDRFKLEQNYPNPFNSSTTIKYALASDGFVRLTVFDLAGRRIATLVDGLQGAGLHQVVWNGTDDEGEAVTSGVYFYKIEIEGKSQTNRMLLLK